MIRPQLRQVLLHLAGYPQRQRCQVRPHPRQHFAQRAVPVPVYMKRQPPDSCSPRRAVLEVHVEPAELGGGGHPESRALGVRESVGGGRAAGAEVDKAESEFFDGLA